MGKFYEEIPENVMEWITKQKVFWVSTAPLSRHGHVNVSPKGGDCFGVPNRKSFWYMDMGSPYPPTLGKGRVLEYGTPSSTRWWRARASDDAGTRSVIVVDVHQVGTSCGYQVPFYNFVDYRRVLEDHFRKKTERYERGNEKESMDRYWALKNAWSMDGLPGMRAASGPAGTECRLRRHRLLVVLVAILAATHPAFEYFPAQRRMQDLLSQVASIPSISLSARAV
ncbi:putative pyridoxamine phosphate oxidase family protein [Rosellinia necatrix]|uniref:Putative pyridoxamine phosphate oxidase family protein n=1 Tax=Rosellinia necatrix TaxID=77044 RepID=A0A1S8AAR5_ROSNE|nr:putative pyridoxamine phosphate oxidase family protein [Rosellinia necatrix]